MTAQLAGGIALAAAAAACFDGALALQALEVRALPPAGAGAGLLGRLLRRPRWLAGTALAVAGWPLQVAALALAPLTVVQPTLAIGLVLLLWLGVRLLGEPARPRDLGAVAAIAAGLAVLAWAAPEPSQVDGAPAATAAVVAALALCAGLPWLVRARLPGMALVGAAGCGYAASGLTTKLLADALGDALGAVLAWAALTAAVAAVAVVDEMAALQRVGAARVAAVAFALQVALPVVCAPLVADERWGATPAGGAAILGGLALVLGGSLALGSAAAVSRLVSAAARR